jgi:hypothetical protein
VLTTSLAEDSHQSDMLGEINLREARSGRVDKKLCALERTLTERFKHVQASWFGRPGLWRLAKLWTLSTRWPTRIFRQTDRNERCRVILTIRRGPF